MKSLLLALAALAGPAGFVFGADAPANVTTAAVPANVTANTTVAPAGVPASAADVTKGIQALADKSSYSWTSTVDGAGNFQTAPTDGQTEKGGYLAMNTTMRGAAVQVLAKGNVSVVSSPDTGGWKTAAELTAAAGDQPGPSFFLVRLAQNTMTPTTQATNLLAATAALTKAGDSITGNFTNDGAKGLLTFGRRPGGGPTPEVTNPRGSVTFTLKEGVLVKYVFTLQGSIAFNGNNFDIDRTTTVEIKNVGTTTVAVPDDAKKKLDAPAASAAVPAAAAGNSTAAPAASGNTTTAAK